jgi:hypothetical protein
MFAANARMPRMVVVHPSHDEDENCISSAGRTQRYGLKYLLMTAVMVHVTNRVIPGSDNVGRMVTKTQNCDSQYGPCNQSSDTWE